jgi:hypothetical protein
MAPDGEPRPPVRWGRGFAEAIEFTGQQLQDLFRSHRVQVIRETELLRDDLDPARGLCLDRGRCSAVVLCSLILTCKSTTKRVQIRTD